MLYQRVCSSRTVRRLDDAEFRAFIAALCLAGESPMRGALLIAEGEPYSTQEIADEAGVSGEVAEASLSKLVKLGTLAPDEDLGCLRFTNWSTFNQEPRLREPKPSETREAWRERKRKQRAKERGDNVVPLAAAGEEPL